jgi:HlyD family secretion protein
LALLALAVIGAGGGVAYWRYSHQGGLPAGIVSGNGRIEADEVDIDTKFAGRIAEMLADEGDMIKAGQVVARMDTRDLEASLRKSQAQVQESQQSLDEARANVEQQKTQLTLAHQEFDRTNTLVARGFATNELLDQRRQALNSAIAALNAANDRVGEAARALDAATHDVELYEVNIADNTLVAPKDGPIQYRIANIGEVLPAGGKVFTMLDVSYVYMDIYLPTQEAGKVKIAADARIVLDARPDLAIPAKVSFIATQAQFTPKTVETKDERDKLMFRIRVKIDPERLRAHAAAVRSGLPGVGYVRFDPAVAWPPQLQGNTAQ